MDIEGKVALVTGASSGIGLATSRLLTARGASVALLARSEDRLRVIAAELPGSLRLTCDVTVEEQLVAAVGRAADHFGRIDILINNAGQGYDAMIEETDVALFRRLFDLYLAAPLVAMKQVIPLMRRQGGGAIVNVSSGTALMHMPGMGAYSAVKAALAHLSLTAREELKEDGIAVTVVYPWVTLTEFERRTIKAHGETGEEESFDHLPHPPDTAEFLAGKIVEARESGVAEVHPHDWMLKLS